MTSFGILWTPKKGDTPPHHVTNIHDRPGSPTQQIFGIAILGSQIALRGIPPEEYRPCITQVFRVTFQGTPGHKNSPEIFQEIFKKIIC